MFGKSPTFARSAGRRAVADRRRRRSCPVNLEGESRTLEPRQMPSVDVLTYHNDNFRTGQNLAETALTQANVHASAFGKLGQVAVDGAVYAQPLVKSGVNVPGRGVHNLVFIATQHDSVYAFDADTLEPIWHRSFLNPDAGITAVPSGDMKATDIFPEIGITGTPVIDPSTSALYVVAKTREVSGKSVGYAQRLHALDLATGGETAGGPVTIEATAPGRGAGGSRGHVAFSPLRELQRPGLLLLNGVVYVGFASLGDVQPYHGWLIGYDARTLRQVSALNTTPDGSAGGIWMGGGAPAADASGNIYLVVGNGTFTPGRRARNFGNSVLKLTPNPGAPRVVDSFTPHDQAKLSRLDLDLGSGGVLLVPDQPGRPHLLITGGKGGPLYLIDRDNMGRYSRRTDHVVQVLPNALAALWATPAYFRGKIYVAGAGERPSSPKDKTPVVREPLKAFTLTPGGLAASPATGTPLYGYPGTTPSISAHGDDHGIVWTLDNGAAGHGGPAILRAYDAADVSRELYDSTQAGARDVSGAAVKFTVPTVANGRVYVGGNGAVTLYGLRGE